MAILESGREEEIEADRQTEMEEGERRNRRESSAGARALLCATPAHLSYLVTTDDDGKAAARSLRAGWWRCLIADT